MRDLVLLKKICVELVRLACFVMSFVRNAVVGGRGQRLYDRPRVSVFHVSTVCFKGVVFPLSESRFNNICTMLQIYNISSTSDRYASGL